MGTSLTFTHAAVTPCVDDLTVSSVEGEPLMAMEGLSFQVSLAE